ncbi:GIY-YIG nuclease family protein [Lysobacter sp. Root690]|uniref:GIY-YIG nuclease family protein n=1 Tax=Lysobacter sp. Root690 TaxID=1736588 RepID=UPI001F415C05|nr:GIY-YIG nuclease family protein [Lysobacter sp. Root690]
MDDNRKHYVYLIACRNESSVYIKIGRSSSLVSRIRNIQTGCPMAFVKTFCITSGYREEVMGLEKLLHMQLKKRSERGEWYVASAEFLRALIRLLRKINNGNFTYEEIEQMPDFCGHELEIMMHRHDFKFYRFRLASSKEKQQNMLEKVSNAQVVRELNELIANG